MYPDFCHCVSTPRAFIQLFNSASVVDLTLPRRDIGLPFQEPRLMRGPVELIQYLARPQPSPAGLTTANRMFPICAPLIGIGGSLTTPPLPHHPACGSAPGGSTG